MIHISELTGEQAPAQQENGVDRLKANAQKGERTATISLDDIARISERDK